MNKRKAGYNLIKRGLIQEIQNKKIQIEEEIEEQIEEQLEKEDEKSEDKETKKYDFIDRYRMIITNNERDIYFIKRRISFYISTDRIQKPDLNNSKGIVESLTNEVKKKERQIEKYKKLIK